MMQGDHIQAHRWCSGLAFSHPSRQVNEAKSMFCGIGNFNPHEHTPQLAQMASEDRFPGFCPVAG